MSAALISVKSDFGGRRRPLAIDDDAKPMFLLLVTALWCAPFGSIWMAIGCRKL